MLARQESQRAAGQRYQQTNPGKRNHAARQARYRERLRSRSAFQDRWQVIPSSLSGSLSERARLEAERRRSEAPKRSLDTAENRLSELGRSGAERRRSEAPERSLDNPENPSPGFQDRPSSTSGGLVVSLSGLEPSDAGARRRRALTLPRTAPSLSEAPERSLDTPESHPALRAAFTPSGAIFSETARVSGTETQHPTRRSTQKVTHQGTHDRVVLCTLAVKPSRWLRGSSSSRRRGEGLRIEPDGVRCCFCGALCRPYARREPLRRRR